MRTLGIVHKTLSRFGALALLPAVAACSMFGPPSAPIPPPSSSAGPDSVTISDTLLAFDMPLGVQPVPELSTVALSALPQQRVPLTLTDPGDAASRLPAPGKGRAYYFLSPGPGITADTRSLTPSFCVNQPTEPSLLRYSVYLLGDGKPQPVIAGQTVAGPGAPPVPHC